jgi:hypothetical protein
MYASRACDACKRRKVKCDASVPCANCRISHIGCEYTIPRRKRGRVVAENSSAPNVVGTQGVGDVPAGETTSSPDLLHRRTALAYVLQPEPRASHQSPESACTVESAPSSISDPISGTSDSFLDARRIHTELDICVDGALSTGTIVDLMHKCIDLFTEYLFPNTPIAHEPTLRAGVSIFLHSGNAPVAGIHEMSTQGFGFHYAKPFTLITALCAFVISVMPESRMSPLISRPSMLSRAFLQASRSMLRLYEEHDLERPDSTSFIIRIWHSAALQNTTGRSGAAWHYFAEATILAQRLQLYDEEQLRRHSAVEAQLLRAIFWLLFMSDKASAVLATRIPTLKGTLFYQQLTLLDNGDNEVALLDMSKSHNQGNLQSRLYLGFHLKRRIWSAAADLIAEIKAYGAQQALVSADAGGPDLDLASLTDRYLVFTGLVDDLPPWLQYPDREGEGLDGDVAAYHRSCFWSQRSNMMTCFHCSKLVILQHCIEKDVTAVLGLNREEIARDMKKVEIVDNFLYELQIVPFANFKVQGEAAVSPDFTHTEAAKL